MHIIGVDTWGILRNNFDMLEGMIDYGKSIWIWKYLLFCRTKWHNLKKKKVESL